MTEVVCVNYPEMEQIAKRFKQQQQQVVNMERSLNSALKALRANGWVGLGSNAFFNEMDSKVLPAVRQLGEALEEASKAVADISNKFSEAEISAANLFQTQDA